MKSTCLLLCLCLLLSSCSNRAIYNLIQAREQNKCYTLPRTQQRDCLDRAGVSYGEYKKAKDREGAGT